MLHTGGFTCSSSIKETASVEAYDPRSDTWSTVADINTKRRGAGAAAIDNENYVVGGLCDNKPLNSVEIYDHRNNKSVFTMSHSIFETRVFLIQNVLLLKVSSVYHRRIITTIFA